MYDLSVDRTFPLDAEPDNPTAHICDGCAEAVAVMWAREHDEEFAELAGSLA